MAKPVRRYPTPRCRLCQRPIRQRVGLRVFMSLLHDPKAVSLLGEAVHVDCFRRMRIWPERSYLSDASPVCLLCGKKGISIAVSLVYFDRRGSFREGPGLSCHLNCVRELLAQPGGLEILMLRDSG